MLRNLIKRKRSSKGQTDQSFFDYSKNEQERIIKEAVDEANEEQLKVIREYEKKHGKVNIKDFIKCRS